MSNPLTDETNGNRALRFSTLWRAMAVLSFCMLSFTTAGLFTWGVWITVTVNSHEKDIARLQERTSTGKGMSQSVNVGDSKAGAAEATARTWLTTKEVAEREKIDERTVINYIAAGQIEPPPVKNGKAWQIAEEFRIVPGDSEDCGNAQSP
jgi:hypothetical protein